MRAGTTVSRPRAGRCSPMSATPVHVSPDVHEVLVHAPRVLGGDRDGDSMLLQVGRQSRCEAAGRRREGPARPPRFYFGVTGTPHLPSAPHTPRQGLCGSQELGGPGLIPLPVPMGCQPCSAHPHEGATVAPSSPLQFPNEAPETPGWLFQLHGETAHSHSRLRVLFPFIHTGKWNTSFRGCSCRGATCPPKVAHSPIHSPCVLCR